MASYDEFDRRDDFDDRVDPRAIQAARSRVATPGMLLIVFGIIGMLVTITELALAFTQPSILHEQLKKAVEGMQPSPERDEWLKQIEDDKAGLQLDEPLNVGSCVVGWLLNFLMVIGGARMRALKSYGLAMTGAICGLIPISGCFCCAMPIGLWAVIVLANSDVREAFRMNARRY